MFANVVKLHKNAKNASTARVTLKKNVSSERVAVNTVLTLPRST